jgi:hypothetical protein
MVQEKEGRAAQKDFFLAGYNEMLRRIEPERVICYHEPFPEMEGNIVYINYEQSSWRHMDDDVVKPKSIQAPADGRRIVKYGYVNRAETPPESPDRYIKWFAGYVNQADTPPENTRYYVEKHSSHVLQLGAGSAYGGEWVPKKPEDERFFGKPNEIIRTRLKAYNIDTLIGNNGRAVKERHYTDHGFPKYHSNPHDHIIKYAPNGSPDWDNSEQINYFDSVIPGFKIYERKFAKMVRIIKSNTP